jgi:hypothetical protein
VTELLNKVRALPDAERAVTLREQIPPGFEAANWCLDALWEAKSAIRSPTATDEERAQWAGLAVDVLAEAQERAVWDDRELVSQRAHLFLTVAGQPFDFEPPEPLDPQSIARAALAGIGPTFDEAREQAQNWPSRSRDVVAALREARQFIRVACLVLDHVPDEELRRSIRQWAALQVALP